MKQLKGEQRCYLSATCSATCSCMPHLTPIRSSCCRAASPEVLLLAEEVMKRLRGEQLSNLSVNQMAGVLRCVVMLVPHVRYPFVSSYT